MTSFIASSFLEKRTVNQESPISFGLGLISQKAAVKLYRQKVWLNDFDLKFRWKILRRIAKSNSEAIRDPKQGCSETQVSIT